ncbi:MAG: 16S rRNA (cytosine(967)-C(5))-methyltransferase RsmB [Planctomycetota bacterium]|nr:MAG: 16S rRNA (cytosine(967)-C(5))-methyltransferase RsmB [Planctomycetota bacterium]
MLARNQHERSSSGQPAESLRRQHGEVSAREAAFDVLWDIRAGRRTAREAIDALLEADRLPGPELGLTMELVMGVIRHRLTLVRLLGSMTDRDWKYINPPVQNILMLGAYQLIWLDRIPAFAAVNEAVEQAKSRGSKRSGQFVNAVLRQLLREIEHRRLPTSQVDTIRAVPIDRHTCCQFRKPIFSDPAIRPIEHLADTTSHPLWLVSRWVHCFGMDQAIEICRAGMYRPPMFIRPNKLRVGVSELITRLSDGGCDAQPAESGEALVILHAAGFTKTAAFREGLCQPQDRTAMLPVQAMDLSPGKVVVDLCAGLGTKTTQMAEIMENKGTVIACDKDETKLVLLRANCERLGLSIVRTVLLANLEKETANLATIDWILIDAPCSNSGVLARRPDARYRIDQRTLDSLSSVQLNLLDEASRLAGPQTRMMYSTCSIEREENEDIVVQFVSSHSGWRMFDSRKTMPSAGSEPADWRDGGYWAILLQK